MDHLQPSRVDPRKQALLEARFFARDKVILDTYNQCFFFGYCKFVNPYMRISNYFNCLSLKDCGADCQQKDGLEAAHGHPPTVVGPSIVGGIGGGAVPIKPPPPTSPSPQGINQQQQGIRSPLPYKQYGPVVPSEIGRAGAPLQQNKLARLKALQQLKVALSLKTATLPL